MCLFNYWTTALFSQNDMAEGKILNKLRDQFQLYYYSVPEEIIGIEKNLRRTTVCFF